MRIAVLSLTRDRVAYTRHCFSRLQELAGCAFDHFIADQNSDDATLDFLEDYPAAGVIPLDDNIGISRGLNLLLGAAGPGYDVYVKFDNDCELTAQDTLHAACSIADQNPSWIVSPHIMGLMQPPPVLDVATVSGRRVGVVHGLGGIFMAIPGWVFNEAGYRYDDNNPIWGMDDVNLSRWFREQGGNLGYLLDFPAWHYQTTAGQRAELPDYFARKDAEYAGA